MKFINKITLSIAIAASTTACFDNAQAPVDNTQANQTPQVSADNTQPNQVPEAPVNAFPQNQAPQASARNVQYTQAQTGFNPAGRWKCVTAGSKPSGENAYIQESIIDSYPDGRFQAQGAVQNSSSTQKFSTQGNWNINRTVQGAEVLFISQYENELGVISPLFFGGFVRNRNLLHSTVKNQITHSQMSCERI